MKKYLFSRWVLGLLLSVPLSFAAVAEQDEKMELSDPHMPLALTKENATFPIRLRSNPSTGFTWVLVQNYNPALIKPIAHHVFVGDSKIMGAPGYETFMFHVDKTAFAAPQQFQLTFESVRPWQANPNPTRMVFTIFTH